MKLLKISNKKIFFMLFVLLINYTQNIYAKETIIWGNVVIPPIHHIASGIGQDQGITDKLIRLMKNNLPEYEHESEILPVSRLVKKLKDSELMCNPSFKKKPEREEYLHYSIPSVFVPSHGVTVRAEDYQKYGGTAASLKQILEDNEGLLGAIRKRSYGLAIDELIENNQAKMDYQTQADGYAKSVVMLTKKRIDYTLSYAIEYGYIRKKLKLEDKIRFIALKEAGEYSKTHFVCSKTPAGALAIAAINKVLLEQRQSESYREILEFWLDPNTIDTYRKDYDREFLTLAD